MLVYAIPGSGRILHDLHPGGNRTRTLRSSMTRPFLCLASLAVILAACDTSPTAPGCTPTSLTQTATLGDTVVLNTGQKYIDDAQGTGAAAEFCDLAVVRYTGRFQDGTTFDSGSFDFGLGYGDVIAGFEQGTAGMRVGGQRRLIVPPSLGYGAQDLTDRNTGRVVIPGNSTLIFDVELLARADG